MLWKLKQKYDDKGHTIQIYIMCLKDIGEQVSLNIGSNLPRSRSRQPHGIWKTALV